MEKQKWSRHVCSAVEALHVQKLVAAAPGACGYAVCVRRRMVVLSVFSHGMHSADAYTEVVVLQASSDEDELAVSFSRGSLVLDT